MNRWAEESLRDSRPDVFWNETVGDVPDARVLIGDLSADLVIIGGGFSGLWAAVQAIEDNTSRQIVVLESERVGFGASSRNGGFCSPSLTHGVLNGESHWPEENAQLVALGDANLDAFEATIRDHHIDCDFQRVGGMDAAVEPWQLEQMEDALPTFKRFSDDVVLLDGEEARGIVNSPTYLGAIYGPGGTALVNPAQLAWGLRRGAEAAGVQIFENSPASGLTQHGPGVQVRTERGSIVAPKAIVATNAYGTPLSRVKRYIIPVYDHVLMTEPLTTDQLGSIGWSGREGVGDWANQFHYYRLSEDNRILWGGYDATYHFNNGVKPQHDQRSETHEKLADHFFTTFPQLEGLRFTHRWGGPVGSSTRFTVTWGTTHKGAVSWVAGYTGLGVGASRFGARVALDLVDGLTTERTELEMVRKKSVPFPPEPARWAGVMLTKRAMQRADRRGGRQGPWLRLLDRFGVGFDS